MTGKPVDVLVVGAGNAALCAALSAREQGADVMVLEFAPEDERGGNSAFTAGAMRVVYDGVDDLLDLMPDLTDAEIARTDFGSYTRDAFFDDMARLTEYRADPDLVEVLIDQSHETLKWMASKGVRFMPIYGRQAFEIDGKYRFWGGLTVETVGGGPGLVESLAAACEKAGIEIVYETRATELLVDDGAVVGVRVVNQGRTRDIEARTVILASGGFEANTEWRTRYLGPGWDMAKVRGSRFNLGDGIRMALEIGASSKGQWSGAHAVQWDMNAPEFGDLAVGDNFQKHSYPWGILINNRGLRFLDEGADFRNYTYAKYGREMLAQPGLGAWQVFDAKVAHLLRDEYKIKQVTKVKSETIKGLADQMDGMDVEQFVKTIEEYNAAVEDSVSFDPTLKDGRRTVGLTVGKTNWANTIEDPPFEAYQVTCGITFTFGGLRVTRNAEVVGGDGNVIPGLFACGELVGGLFYFNYPGGTGLTSGSVFGRIAGRESAKSLV
jgi:tricarballylate dehydrogenase